MLDCGTYQPFGCFQGSPTPVEWLEPLSTAATSLWVKRDDLTNPIYGGSKVRKLGPLLEDAKRRGATRLVTVGALGSHHVLATGLFGRLAGLQVEALILSQPRSAHVLETVRASAGQGVTLIPVASYTEAVRQLAARAAAGAYSIPAGGTNLLGTLGLLEAAAELAQQVHAGLLPEPDLLVLPLGSGGTAAGLVAGLVQAGLRTRVLAVAVAEPSKVFAHKARALAKALLAPSLHATALQRLEIERGYLGEGYGYPSSAGEHATRQAERVGLTLDATYTAKAFAAALARVAFGSEQHILFWHTLSSRSLLPLLKDAPQEHELAIEVRRLAR